MELHNLKPAKGAVNKDKRLGRGQGSTRGGTATRGHKGQKSRSGYSKAFGFEGGQMPLQRRVPKHGFKNISRKEYKAINLSTLQELSEKKKITKIDVETLIKAGLASRKSMIKILGNGKLDAKLEVKAHAFSEAAQKAIEAKEGTIEKIQ
jgi:large subunit ribosomal protein L15